MKTLHLLPLAAFASAFVVPDAQVFQNLAIEDTRRQSPLGAEWNKAKDTVSSAKHTVESALDRALSDVSEDVDRVHSWAKDNSEDAWSFIDRLERDSPHHPHGPPEDGPHHPPPHHGPPPPHHGGPPPPHHGPPPPHHGPPPPHHGGPPPHHGPHHRSNKTVYELISESKYTTKLAKLINDYPDLVDKLNGTAANYTVFAPTDKAFEKIPEHAHKPSKEMLEKLLHYHISADFYPAGRVLGTHTIPTLLKGKHLSSEPRSQRLSINFGLRGLTVNFYSRIVAIDIFASNGVIHGVDHLLLPPPNVIEVIDLLPTEFSTLELALTKTGLLDTLNSTDHAGGTFFAPSNFAFQKLGPKINMFLFSSHGQKYLRALMLYHVATGTTLYSDSAYVADSGHEKQLSHAKTRQYKREARKPFNPDNMLDKRSNMPLSDPSSPVTKNRKVRTHRVHKSYHHYDLPTMLNIECKRAPKLNVDVFQYGPYIGMQVNGFSRVIIQDGIAQDGVIQTVSDVLIPPHGRQHRPRNRRAGRAGQESWSSNNSIAGAITRVKKVFGLEEPYMSVEDFKARFVGLVQE